MNSGDIESLKVNFEALKQSLSKKFEDDFDEDLWLQRLTETIDCILARV